MLITVFWHAEFISALKTEPNPTVFGKNAKNKMFIIIIFLFFVILFSKLQAKLHKNNGIMFLEGNKPNAAKMVLIY